MRKGKRRGEETRRERNEQKNKEKQKKPIENIRKVRLKTVTPE